MSSGKQAERRGKPGRKKLALRKETLKDLTAANGPIKGGARPPVQDSERASCSCLNC